MIIEGDCYRLTPVNSSSSLFDLELKYHIGGKNPRDEFKTEGYGYTFQTAIKHIVQYMLSEKYPDDKVIELKQYIKEFKELQEKLLNETV
jgi:hypothetical protein